MPANVIDLETWDRRHSYLYFRSLDMPHFSLTAPVDVTAMWQKSSCKKFSIFNAALFCIMRTINDIPEFLTRFRGDQIIRHDLVHPSFTVPIADNHFAFCQAPFIDDWPKFDSECRDVMQEARQQTALIDETAHEDHWIYLSCIPWLDFTAATHPLQGKDDCTPRISWGKIVEENGKARMSVNLQAHHALMDGLHAAHFFKGLEENIVSFSDQVR